MDDICTIRLAGPGKNALGTDMMRFLIDALHQADGQPVLLTGVGDTFSAGLNLKELLRLDGAGIKAFLQLLDDLLQRVFYYPGPIAAAVNGHAIAGGCLLALFCDVRIGIDTPSARIGLNEVALGLAFPPQLLAMVRRCLPYPQVETVVLDAELYPMHRAVELGLLDGVATDVVAVAEERLARRAAHSPSAYRESKNALRGNRPETSPADAQNCVDRILPLWTSDAVKTKIKAALGQA